jgi:hypothetical protein
LKFKIMKNESKKQRDFNSITIDINFTTNIWKPLWGEKVWGAVKKMYLGAQEIYGRPCY